MNLTHQAILDAASEEPKKELHWITDIHVSAWAQIKRGLVRSFLGPAHSRQRHMIGLYRNGKDDSIHCSMGG